MAARLGNLPGKSRLSEFLLFIFRTFFYFL